MQWAGRGTAALDGPLKQLKQKGNAAPSFSPASPVKTEADRFSIERLTQIAVIISLFTAGLKLRLSGSDQRWRAPILLAALAMVRTIGGIAAFAVAALGLPTGAAVLLGRCSRRRIRS